MAKDEAWIRPRRPVLRWLLTAALVAGVLVTAVWSTTRLVEEVRDPGRACAQRLPAFEHVQIVSARRTWSPPLIRCTYAIAAIDLAGPLPRVEAVTAKHLVLVGAIDVAALGVLGLGRRRWRRRG